MLVRQRAHGPFCVHGTYLRTRRGRAILDQSRLVEPLQHGRSRLDPTFGPPSWTAKAGPD